MRLIPSPWTSLLPHLGPGNPPVGSSADGSFVQIACEPGGTGQTNGDEVRHADGAPRKEYGPWRGNFLSMLEA